jgi:hypothetical protein
MNIVCAPNAKISARNVDLSRTALHGRMQAHFICTKGTKSTNRQRNRTPFLIFFSSSRYFLSRAGGVDPWESPLHPAKVAPEPWSSSLIIRNRLAEQLYDYERNTYSMRSNALYFATRSLRAGAPVLIWPTPRATDRSAMMVFSVSPLRWEIMTPQPSD